MTAILLSMCGVLGCMQSWTDAELEKEVRIYSEVNKEKWICQVTGEGGKSQNTKELK